MLGYRYEDIDRMKFTLNMASFYLPPAQDTIKDGIKEIHELLEGLLVEGHIR